MNQIKDMKSLVSTLATLAFLTVLAGCSSPGYDPTRSPNMSAGDKVQIASISVKPQRPVAPEPWRASMKVRNVSSQPLKDVSYTINVTPGMNEIGRGTIAEIKPGETVEVKSDVARFEQGTYRVEGKVFLPKDPESFNDRMNNIASVMVTVAQ
jgi:hypothetical protein